MDGYRPETYGEAFADVYDDWYGDVSPAASTAAFLAARTTGPVLELGSGTGRLAGPLQLAAGCGVVGLDVSVAMLSRSRHGWPAVAAVCGDMVAPPVRDRAFGAVLVAFNTLFNLPSADAQIAALSRAGDTLTADGIVVVEAFVPTDTPSRLDSVDIVRMDADVVVLRASRVDPAAGTVDGHHIELRDGAPIRLRPWRLCFCGPDELDRRAAAAGLVLRERLGGWDGERFDADSDRHVSVYGLAPERQ